MTQTATVRRLVSTKKAEVAVRRASACGHHCATCAGCKMYDRPEVIVMAENEAGARPGDTVTVESSTPRVLGIAVVVYLLPFLLFFGLYLLAGVLGLSGPVAVTLAVAGFAAGAGGDLLLDRRVRKTRGIAFRIVSVRKE